MEYFNINGIIVKGKIVNIEISNFNKIPPASLIQCDKILNVLT